jgi:SAM-dependent methyltransferase
MQVCGDVAEIDRTTPQAGCTASPGSASAPTRQTRRLTNRFGAAVLAAARGWTERPLSTTAADNEAEPELAENLPSHLPLRRRLISRTGVSDLPVSTSEHEFWDLFYRQKRDRFFKHRYNLRAAFPELVPPSVRAAPHRHVPVHEPLRPLVPDARHVLESSPDEPSHWMLDDFEPALTHGKVVVAECGCGVGNALIPLLRANPDLFFFAFDYSLVALRLLLLQPEFDQARIYAYCADLGAPAAHTTAFEVPHAAAETRSAAEAPVRSAPAAQRWTTGVYRAPPLTCDFVTCVWTLSALPVASLPLAASRLAAMLRPGGALLLRDYAVGDLAELRHPACARVGTDPQRHEYLRGDGTRVHYFQVAELENLFQQAGLQTEYAHIVEREIVNRQKRLVMHRRWIAGKWRKPDLAPAPARIR